MDLIAGSQTLPQQFKSVTGKTMKKRFSFICLQAGALRTLGHYCTAMQSLKADRHAPQGAARDRPTPSFETADWSTP